MNLCGISYDPTSHTFLSFGGKPYGWLERGGYGRCFVDGKKVGIHRVVLELHGIDCTGSLVDHIDGNTHNNCIANLRIASHRENAHNQKLRIDNSSGCKGVGWSRQKGKWRVRITLPDGKSKHIGFFSDKDAAVIAATNARELYHGRFANHG